MSDTEFDDENEDLRDAGFSGVADYIMRLEATRDELRAHVRNLEELLRDLANAEAAYRDVHDRSGDGTLVAGRAWDAMRKAGDRARAAIGDKP